MTERGGQLKENRPTFVYW